MNTARRSRPWLLAAALAALTLPLQARQLPIGLTFGPGDIFVSLEPGPVQWWTPGGLLRRVLLQTVAGTGEGMAFDSSGNLYVTRWCIDGQCQTGNTVEKYNNLGLPLGKVGPAFNCQPHTILFAGPTAYVGQAGCQRSILETPLDTTITAEYRAAQDFFGVFWMDLGADGCTMYYTSFGPNVKRYDVCGNRQLANFNAAPLPGGSGQDLRVLADGGVLVSSGDVVARLDAQGELTQTYFVPGEGALYTGLDLVGDGTFWVGNYFSSNLHHFDLDDGTRLGGFNAGTPANTVVGVRVMR